MRKVLNKEHIEGRVYEHNLTIKTVQNKESKNYGKEFIGGTLDIATDEDCLNVVTITFTYVTETTAKGAKNDTYAALKNIIETGKTVLVDGKDVATMVKVDTALALNDFYTSKNGQETLVSAKRNEGGFVHIVTKLADPAVRNTFEMDMLINGTRLVEADEEKRIAADYLIVKGAVFNFKNAILPVEFIVKNPNGIKYFEGLDASPSNMTFTKVWGKINSETIKTVKEEVSAFGDAKVTEYERTIKEWVITGTANEPYEIDDEQNGITMDEIKKALADREVYLADVKKKQDEYQASKGTAGAGALGGTGVTAAQGGFNF